MSILHKYIAKGEMNFIHLQIVNKQRKPKYLHYMVSIYSPQRRIHKTFSGWVLLSPFQTKNIIFPIILFKTGKYYIETKVNDGKIMISSETKKNDYFYVIDLVYEKSNKKVINKSDIEFPIMLFAENKILKKMLHPKEKLTISNFKYLNYGGNVIINL